MTEKKIKIRYNQELLDTSLQRDGALIYTKQSSLTLEGIISTIERNITTKEDSKCKLYTIHSYKGLEDDNIRIANDNEDRGHLEGDNIYYVALTRGMKNIIED